MKTSEKIKRIILVALGFAFSTYLIVNGVAILKQDDVNATKSKEPK